MGTDVKIGLVVGLALLVVVVLYFGARSDDHPGPTQSDKPAVATKPAEKVEQVALKPASEAHKPLASRPPVRRSAPARKAEAKSVREPVPAKPAVPAIAKAAAPVKKDDVAAKPAKSKPVVGPAPVRPTKQVPAPARTPKPIEPIVTSPRRSVKPTKPTIYTVKDGDAGFWGVAVAVYGDGKHMDLIKAANPKADPHKLRAGQKLVVPPLTGVTGMKAGPVAPKAPNGYEIYTVKDGDAGFWGVAKSVYGRGTDWTYIARANPGVDSNDLQPGQRLLIPPRSKSKVADKQAPKPSRTRTSGSYTVKAGDTGGFWGVAKEVYGDGKHMDLIAAANPGVNPGKLKIGQKLVVPPLSEARKSESRLPRLQRPRRVEADGDNRPVFD